MFGRKLTQALIVSLASVSSIASADLINISYRGTVISETMVTGNSSVLSIGTKISGEFVFDTSATEVVIDSGRSRYDNALVANSVKILNNQFTMVNQGTIFIDNDSISNFDAFRTGNDAFSTATSINGFTLVNANVSLIDNSQNVFSTTDLPTAIEFGDFDVTRMILTFENATQSEVTNYTVDLLQIPEPSNLGIVTLLILTVFEKRERRQKNQICQ